MFGNLLSRLIRPSHCSYVFFFNDAAPPEIYPLPQHAALPTCRPVAGPAASPGLNAWATEIAPFGASPRRSSRLRTGSIAAVYAQSQRSSIGVCTPAISARRSEEHTSELQSQSNLVCRLLLEKT